MDRLGSGLVRRFRGCRLGPGLGQIRGEGCAAAKFITEC